MNNEQFDVLEFLSVVSDVLQVINYFSNQKQDEKLELLLKEVKEIKEKVQTIEQKIGGQQNESNPNCN